jgi:DNA glycosylase AlkZ-like
MRSLSWQQVYARRLAASRLDVRAPHEELLDVARATLGAHAQLLTGAELALSARVEGVTREGVRDLLWKRRELVKGNTIRGTLHLHPVRDYALWKSLRPARWREQKWLDWQELTLADAEYLREAVLAVLDEPRTREEIGAAVGGTFGDRIATDSWGHLLAPSSNELCHGPPRGRKVTFVRCDRWVPGWRLRDRDDALRELVRRYVETYGPVRRDELEHWFAFKLPADAFADLEEVDVEGVQAYVLPGTAFPDAEPSGVRLLAHYDVYVIACHPREHLIPEQKERIFLRGAGPNPALLVDGRVGGVWSRALRGRRMEIEVEPFERLSDAQRRALEDDAARVARTYGAEATLVER